MGRNYHNVHSVRELLEVLSRRWRLRRRLPMALLPERWSALVGEPLARHVQPLTIRNGELVLAVDSPAWMSELQFQLPTLTARIQQGMPRPAVKRLLLTLAPLTFDEEKARNVPLLPDLNERERASVEGVAMTCADPELRETVRRAMSHTKRLQKLPTTKQTN